VGASASSSHRLPHPRGSSNGGGGACGRAAVCTRLVMPALWAALRRLSAPPDLTVPSWPSAFSHPAAPHHPRVRVSPLWHSNVLDGRPPNRPNYPNFRRSQRSSRPAPVRPRPARKAACQSPGNPIPLRRTRRTASSRYSFQTRGSEQLVVQECMSHSYDQRLTFPPPAPVQHGRPATATPRRGATRHPATGGGTSNGLSPSSIDRQLVVSSIKTTPLYRSPPSEPDSVLCFERSIFEVANSFRKAAGAGRGTWPTTLAPRKVFYCPTIMTRIALDLSAHRQFPDETALHRGAAKPCVN